jgi:predicted membrane metal-binding protein
MNILNERNINSISISFPEACWMKTKKGTYDFAFNLQEIMTENHIILTGILLTQSNDRKSIKNVLNDIYETIKLFIEMQREFGERKNYSEIRRRIREHILIADSGYFSTENLYYLFKNKINALSASHLLCISGLHLSLFISLIQIVNKIFKLKEDKLNLLICIFLSIYCVIVNFSYSVLRVSLVFILKYIFDKKKIEFSSLDILSLVGIIILLLNNYALFSLSFQL